MKDHDLENFEADLQRLEPAEPPPTFMARLADAVETAQVPSREKPIRQTSLWDLLAPWLRWFASAAAAVVVALLVWRGPRAATTPEAGLATAPADSSALKADNVQFDRRLVGAFDALAELPSGETVRFRCQEWADQMTLRDAARGIEVVQSTPSFEVLPVGFETY